MRVIHLCAGLLAAAAALAQPVSIQFKSLDRSILAERLNKVSTKNPERAQRLLEMFQEAGCTGDRLRQQAVKGSKIPNIICTLPGQTEAAIIVGAHLDWWGEAGQGVVDNWSGAALLPSLYQSVPQGRRHTLIFVGFADRESDPAGSRFYVRELSREERSRMRAMVQLSSLGTAAPRVWMNESDPKLVSELARVAAALKVTVTGVDAEQVGTDDASAFRQAKVPTISLHSLTQQTFPILGSARDTPEAIRMDDYYATYRLVAAYLMLLDAVLSPPATQ